MDNITYELILRINTPQGDEIGGKFFLGNSAERAYALFNSLEGDAATPEKYFIFFELIEIQDGLPGNLKMKACNLSEAGANCKIILKELFARTLR